MHLRSYNVWVRLRLQSAWFRWTTALVTLAAIVWLYRLWTGVSPATVALTLLLYILLLATSWGLRYAVIVSLLATACYNFFFLPPINTFTINDPQNWLALFAFLVVSVFASRLSARIRAEAQAAQLRQSEVEVLYRLGRALLRTDHVAELLASIPESVREAARAHSVLLFLLEGERSFTSFSMDAGRVELGVADLFAISGLSSARILRNATEVGSNRYAVPMHAGVRPRGALVIDAPPLSIETLDAMAGLVSIAIDRAQALEEATRSEAEKASERLRVVMLDSITHELRTPLTSIKASVSTLLMPGSQLAADHRAELLTVIDEECDRLNRLVAQSLEMAKLDAQRVRMRPRELAVADLVQGALRSSAAALAGRQVRVTVPEELAPIHADPEWMEKVLCHLLDNAAKYSPREAPIEIEASAAESTVTLAIADHGSGVSSEDKPRIFEKFYRGGAHRQKVPGTGMGLAICRVIVEAHNGSIAVTGRAEQGAVFRITLPAFAANARHRASRGAALPGRA